MESARPLLTESPQRRTAACRAIAIQSWCRFMPRHSHRWQHQVHHKLHHVAIFNSAFEPGYSLTFTVSKFVNTRRTRRQRTRRRCRLPRHCRAWIGPYQHRRTARIHDWGRGLMVSAKHFFQSSLCHGSHTAICWHLTADFLSIAATCRQVTDAKRDFTAHHKSHRPVGPHARDGAVPVLPGNTWWQVRAREPGHTDAGFRVPNC